MHVTRLQKLSKNLHCSGVNTSLHKLSGTELVKNFDQLLIRSKRRPVLWVRLNKRWIRASFCPFKNLSGLCRWGLRKQKETDVKIKLHVPAIFDVPLQVYVHHSAEEQVALFHFAQSVN